MKAMVLRNPKTALEWTDLPDRHPGTGQIRVKVLACGVCRTDLHILDGELRRAVRPFRSRPRWRHMSCAATSAIRY
jgi:alcohol dehydrogenase, propanol-preferring